MIEENVILHCEFTRFFEKELSFFKNSLDGNGFNNWICKAWFDNICKAVLGRLILLSLSRFSILLNTTVDNDTGTD